MKLNIYEAMEYLGIGSKNTFLKRKIPFTKEGRQKLYTIEHIEAAFSDKKDMPRVLPNKAGKGKNVPVPVPVPVADDIITIPEFVLNEDVQKQFDEVVDHLGDNYHAVHNGVIESLLLVQHTKRFYHKQVMDNPLSDWSKLLDQTIKQEISILKTLGLAA